MAGRHPFLQEIITLVLASVLVTIIAVQQLTGRRPPWSIFLHMQVLGVLYPIATIFATDLLACKPVEALVSYDAVTMEPVIERRLALSSNPYTTCFQGQHLHAAIPAIISLVVFTVGMPVYTMARLLRSDDETRQEWSARSCRSPFRYFCGADFQPDRWYYRHLNWGLVCLLAVELAVSPLSPGWMLGTYALSVVGVVGVLTLALVQGPFAIGKVCA